MMVFRQAIQWKMTGSQGIGMRGKRKGEREKGKIKRVHNLAWLVSVVLLWLMPGQGIVAQPATYRVVATVDLPVPVVGQQVIYTFRLYAVTLPVYDYTPPDFAGWWLGETLTSRAVEVVDGTSYQVLTIETLLYPARAGNLTIQPATLVIPATVFTDRVVLTTEAVTVQVQPLPNDAPRNFKGAVGRFDTDITLDKTTVMLGEPVMLRYKITGSGNIEQLAPPELMLPDGWRAYANPSITQMQTRGFGERTFEWRLIPEKAASYEFPAMPFRYFDPQTGQYEVSLNPSFQVDVLPSASGQRELPTFTRNAGSGNAPAALAIKAVPPDLQTDASGISGLFWLLPPGGVLVVWSIREGLNRRRVSLARQRQLQALQAAKARLQHARKTKDQQQAFRLIYETICQYAADKLNLPAATPYDIIEVGQQERLNMAEVLNCLQLAEDGRYTPPGIISVEALAAKTADALTVLDKGWWV